MLIDQIANDIIENFLGDIDAIMVFGSQAGNEFLNENSDLDLLVIANSGFCRGFQNQIVNGIKTDITIIPMVNLDLFLLREMRKDAISAIIYALHTGRIIKDKYGQLAFYKDFSSTLFINKKHIYPYSSDRFRFMIGASEKLINDYKSRTAEALESFVLLSQIIDSIINIELIFSLGWSTHGKLKIGILKRINPELYVDLQNLINDTQTLNGKRAIELNLLAPHLERYRELLNTQVLLSGQNTDLFVHKLGIRIEQTSTQDQVYCLFSEYLKNGSCQIYFKYSSPKLFGDHYGLIVMLGDHSFFDTVALPILKHNSLTELILDPTLFPLQDIFHGGRDTLDVSEKFYVWLCSKLTDKSLDMDKSVLMMSVLLIHLQLSIAGKVLYRFCNYLFDQWFPYNFSQGPIDSKSPNLLKKDILLRFDGLFQSQKEVLEYLNDMIKELIDRMCIEEEWLNDLFSILTSLINATKQVSRYVPEFETRLLKAYDGDELWYIYRKQLEDIFSILSIEEENWSCMVFFFQHIKGYNV